MKLRKDKWDAVKLGDVCELINGRAYSAHELLSEGTPVLRVGNFFTNDKWYYSNMLLEDKKYCDCGDLLYAWSASFGPRIWKGEKVIFHYHIWKIDVSKKITKQFLYYVLENETDKIKSDSHGTTMPHITKTAMEKHLIPLPPLSEQKQIAALFQSIETAMERVERQEKNLLQLKNNLLSDLFSDKQEFGSHLKAKDFETVKFDKIAINISERVEPKKTELKTYVGLEHLDADNLKIERTGTPVDVIGTKLKIYKGDIIFGKRRAYLRKVAVSHFDGIASAHSMILRANEKNIEKDFLPYFMQSDAFMNRAVQISEGSLSPTIKVKSLAEQKFILPKKEKQKELIDVFKQFDTTLEQLKQQKATLKNLKQKLLNEILG
jgi:type I restriction enzyme S subunit